MTFILFKCEKTPTPYEVEYIMVKNFLFKFQVQPAKQFAYDHKLLHRKIQIICTIFRGPPRSLKFSHLITKYVIRYHTCGTWWALVETTPFDRMVVGSNPALAA